jgi:probable rRNA maturation factor
MITIKNTQRSLTVNSQKLKKTVQKILDRLNYADFDIGIWLTTNETIRKYNKQYRNKDKATDILSFPFYPDLKAGERITTEKVEEKNLGDIIISLEYVLKDAPKWDQSFAQRMDILLVHGICHLLGYDHLKDEDYTVMKEQEELLLQEIGR